MLSLIIPAYNAQSYLTDCFASIAASKRTPDQIIVVDDSSTDGTLALARKLCSAMNNAVVLQTPRSSGAGDARNLGVQAATGDLLFFLDSDCLLHPDTLSQAEEAFARDPQLQALIGAYDLAPQDPSFISRYRNLLHSYHHHRGKRAAQTFWGACGAIRKSAFLAVGGFRPGMRQIEDIELGNRLVQNGIPILLDPAIQVKHCKRWTLSKMFRTDVFDRAIPWTRLILANQEMPNDLNTSHTQRLSVFFTLLAPWVAILYSVKLALALLGIVVFLNWGFYTFLAKNWSPLSAVAAIPLHLFYFAYSGLAFAIALGQHYWQRNR